MILRNQEKIKKRKSTDVITVLSLKSMNLFKKIRLFFSKAILFLLLEDRFFYLLYVTVKYIQYLWSNKTSLKLLLSSQEFILICTIN